MFDDFIKRFEEKEQDAFVLIKHCIGAGHNKGFLEMMASSYAMVFCNNGVLDRREGTLKWPINKEDLNTDLGFGRLKKEHIYKLRLRKLLDNQIPKGAQKNKVNCYYVSDVLDNNPSCKELEDILYEYQKKVVYCDDILGELVLNREFDWLETDIAWGKKNVNLIVSVDIEDKDSWDNALVAARNMVSKAEVWDELMKKTAAKELTELANEWAEEDKNTISEDEFAKRITIESLSFTDDGEFTVYYSDDDMFWGHSIEIFGNIEKGIQSCNIVG